MQITVTFRHMESTPALKEHATERVSRVAKYLPHATAAHIILCVEKLSHKAEIKIDAGSIHCRGEAHSDDMYKSVDEATDKIIRQVKRYQEKIHNHKPKVSASDLPVAHKVFGLPTENGDHLHELEFIETKQIMAKPMTINDALMHMDLVDNNFFIFKNVDSNQLSVLYRRDGGRFGLIETSI